MEKETFEKAALEISEKMSEWADGREANFGFITQDGEDYRVFMGGRIDDIKGGIIAGFRVISAMFVDNDERMKFFEELFENAQRIVISDRDRMVQ